MPAVKREVARVWIRPFAAEQENMNHEGRENRRGGANITLCTPLSSSLLFPAHFLFYFPFCHYHTRRQFLFIFIEPHSSQARLLPSSLPSTLTNCLSFP